MKKGYIEPVVEVVEVKFENICDPTSVVEGDPWEKGSSAAYRSTPEEYRSSLWND